mmetsp:Transcript_28051/g.59040  ORF Transcript_28051/g.59040 Transcript_28051/m.59040 type:complete len:92 (+) Transcript_28051:658-933(+)
MIVRNNKEGRDHPSQVRYEKELELFGGHILLAKKLRDSGIFEKKIDVYLNAVIANKRKWEHEGKSFLREYLSDHKGMNQSSNESIHQSVGN